MVEGVFVAVLALLSGCGEGEPDTTMARRDSLGVTIFEHGMLEGDVFELDGPLYRIGGEAGGREWGRVVSGAVLPDGRAAVADELAREIVVLSAAGIPEAVLGGHGDGPGEFRNLRAVLHVGSDTLFAVDPSLARGSWFVDGSFSHSQSLDPRLVYRMRPIGYVADELVLASANWDPWVEVA